MRRRQFLGSAAAVALAAKRTAAEPALGSPASLCDCSFLQAAAAGQPEGAAAFRGYGSKVKITNVKVFGVSISPDSDRPYVFVKLETDAGLVGWGEGTLEGKAGAVMACVNDFRDLIVGADPMQSEHYWQSMYVHSFYRAGPVIGSAISGIDQAMWDLRGKILGLPVYKLLGGPNDPAGVRGYYASNARTLEELRKLRESAASQGITCFKGGLPGYYEWIDTNDKITAAVRHIQTLREGLGPDIDVAVDFHAKTSPSVASIIAKEVEPLNLLWVEEPCPPENVKAMARIARRTTTPIATGERLVAAYNCRELIEMGVVDIIQTDMNHVGGITALWKVAMAAAASGISIAPHGCEGPIGLLASCHLDSAIPNFLIQECCGNIVPQPRDKIWLEWFGFPAMRMVNGKYPLTEKPGLGFDLTEESLAKYPFGGSKPMARVFFQDGSVGEW
jgi:galactonate dehydratase